MGLEYRDGIVGMNPGIYDVHAHPRVFDSLPDGKAGLASYTETALRSGITMITAMPNESYRLPEVDQLGRNQLVQCPISNADRARFMEVSIQAQSKIRASYNFGIDAKEALGRDDSLDIQKIRANFINGAQNATALKLWGDESTGGQNIPIEHFPAIFEAWHGQYPHKPIITHLEDGNVGAVLGMVAEMPDGKNIPIHIAHVSSSEELEAVIEAKERGMNVTCEVTPHHLFASDEAGAQIGGYGCMKPSLKGTEDVAFLWDHIRYIDIIASDCAPHRQEEKEGLNPAWGVTNHTVMMPLLFGAVDEGRLTLEDIYQKMVVNPRQRFNMPLDDGTYSSFDLHTRYLNSVEVEAELNPEYGQNIFPRLEAVGQRFNLVGRLVMARSGESLVRQRGGHLYSEEYQLDLSHLVKLPHKN